MRWLALIPAVPVAATQVPDAGSLAVRREPVGSVPHPETRARPARARPTLMRQRRGPFMR